MNSPKYAACLAIALVFSLTSCKGGAPSGAAPGPEATGNSNTKMAANEDPRAVADRVDAAALDSILATLTGRTPFATDENGTEVFISERGSQKGRQRAAEYMKAAFESLGIPTRILEFRANGKTGYNVEATLKGSGSKHVWVTAHLDSAGNAGANDDASGLAALLLAAAALKAQPLTHTVHFVAYDLEELGSLGSADYLATVVRPILNTKGRSSVIGNLHSDMIGYDDGSNTGVISTCGKSGDIGPAVVLASELLGAPVSMREVCLGRSDHRRFWEAGLPAALLTDNTLYDDYPWYHLAADTEDKLSKPYLLSMIRTKVVSIALLAG